MSRMRGPIGSSPFVSSDVQAPGVGRLISFEQEGNAALNCFFESPTSDADGSDLSGINGVTVGLVRAAEDGTNPVVDDGTFDSMILGKTEIPVTSGGSTFEARVPIPEVGVAYFVIWQFWEESGS